MRRFFAELDFRAGLDVKRPKVLIWRKSFGGRTSQECTSAETAKLDSKNTLILIPHTEEGQGPTGNKLHTSYR